jgi:hypothetical protein
MAGALSCAEVLMTTTRDITVITDQSTRDELVEALGHMNHRARREFPKVGTPEVPTPWDLRHASLNALLTDLEHCGR